MTYKVTTSTGGYSYNIKLTNPYSYKSTFSSTIQVSIGASVATLNDLTDVEISGTNDKYVLMYDQSSGKWKDVNPDVVLSASSNTETIQPGLPADFVNTLDVDLDDRIDVDAGTF
jgi:hypothetical protein